MWFLSIVRKWGIGFASQLVLLSNLWCLASGLGSMSSIAISYGENGSVFCGIKPDGSHLVSCYGSNSAIIYGTPSHLQFIGLTAGDGFTCGLLMSSNRPYCWGNSGYIQMGVPQPMFSDAEYVEISAGDYHLCGLRKPLTGRRRNNALVDCWGYNMTQSFEFDGRFDSITAGSVFNCGLFSQNASVFCWGEESTSRVISLVPKEMRFRKIAAGGYHVCGILEGVNSRVFCWGKSLEFEQEIDVSYSGQQRINVAPPKDQMVSVVGGRFHACGIKSLDHNVICWGFIVRPSTPAPANVKFYEIAAGNYFTCGVSAEKPLSPICWGGGFPASLPLAVSPGLCRSGPCAPGFYELLSHDNSVCKSPGTHLCLPCSNGCPDEMYQKTECTLQSDRVCDYNCSSCSSNECFIQCKPPSPVVANGKGNGNFQTVQLPIIVTEMAVVVFVTIIVSVIAILYVRYRLRNCRCLATRKVGRSGSSFTRDIGKVRPDLDEMKITRARAFTYDELEKATGGFKEESLVGKGSFSCVYKGVLRDGTIVAVKKAIMSSSDKQQKNSREFHTELDLLSRLNHAHLLNLLGYCEEGGERLLVYEYMAHGSLHQQLHGENKDQLNWVRRVTIAVQAARGIEYLHGYACPPVIHRDIKSSNILIDEDQNARVADFGLSLLGPADSSSPLAELPAGTLGYLDPEYYRLHYLTTKSDVYSFGVLLLEILSGRKAIDMRYEEGNVVEWAVPLIKSGDISAILDPSLDPPSDPESLRRIANVACKCVRMRGKERPSMEKVTTALERSLAQLMGRTSCNDDRLPILPSEVVLGSSRMHKKSSRMSSDRSVAETAGTNAEGEFREPSWITFPSVTSSSQRRKSSASDADVEGRMPETTTRNGNNGGGYGDVLRILEEEIGPASPQESLFLQHNF